MQKLGTLPISPLEAIDQLKTEMDQPVWENRLLDLMKLAANNDKNVWAMIYQIIREADSGRLSWGYHKVLLSGMVYLLAYVGDSKSYRVLVNYVKSLDRTIPIGAMELISDLLPTFAELDIRELFSIAANTDELKSAFGVLALCKLNMENRLSDEEKTNLKSFLSDYQNLKYYLNDTIELTLEQLSETDSSDMLSELDGIML
ncbi:hypothetical protein EHQ92_02750 [Leptospira biflexa]|uniref:Uncharacterized protein n=1 Tax=Leptospira biflexa serovar Patoc (strain Patoc 1 / ATCC 23582 / Paris) TaxID=456481 RepID=B0SQW0_LEPBP|nr:hypothetical protein [Leptospira biflexa]ABZ95647.1 Hypothetical protein LBF_3178 [Leptospira biflexa serovar Patoc strain 'Patoc 1 (Ames)']ABZ99357.1 Conserved hypothetical protein [Leptospira biflexa serovar Patoc strain 'Patoc 1 (Paris)']TGM37326.1 hypothetical protein EHQ80_06900 [Leptospira biflexa]TGM40663.1 hypothetical protein EHQ89_01465 [Leptospira biflexa]TGM46866.1 hypothetical protein EHQ92_02750 [Leptospira biflexa]